MAVKKAEEDKILKIHDYQRVNSEYQKYSQEEKNKRNLIREKN